MPYCCVPFCKNEKGKTSGISYHEFPVDSDLRNTWLRVISRENFTPNTLSNSSVVCSEHFTDADYKPNCKIKILKPGSIPSRFPNYPPHKIPVPAISKRQTEKQPPDNQVCRKCKRSENCKEETDAVVALNAVTEAGGELEENVLSKLKALEKEPQGSSVGSASGGDGCGSRVGQPAGPPPPRRTYSQLHCAVYRCATNCHRMPSVAFHAFPKDERLRREWLARCGHTSEVNVKNSRVCSAHFRPEDYERDLRNELLGLPLKRKLMPTAVPTLNLPSEEEGEPTECRDVSTKRFGRSRKKLRNCAANCSEGDKMDAVVQQILMNPPKVIIKEEPVVQEECERDPGDVGAAAQQDFEFVSVKEEPVEGPDESTSPTPEEKPGRPRKIRCSDSSVGYGSEYGVVGNSNTYGNVRTDSAVGTVSTDGAVGTVSTDGAFHKMPKKRGRLRKIRPFGNNVVPKIPKKRGRPRKIRPCDNGVDNSNTNGIVHSSDTNGVTRSGDIDGVVQGGNIDGVVHKMLKKRGCPRKICGCDDGGEDNCMYVVIHKMPKRPGRPRKIQRCDGDGGNNRDGVLHKIRKKPGRPRKVHRFENGGAMYNMGGVPHQMVKKRGRPRKIHHFDCSGDNKNMNGVMHKVLKKQGHPRKVHWCDDGGNNNRTVKNPQDMVMKEEVAVKQEVEWGPDGAVDAGRPQDFEFVAVKEEPVEYPEVPEYSPTWQECDNYIDPLYVPDEVMTKLSSCSRTARLWRGYWCQ